MLLCPNAFKHSLSAVAAAKAMAEGVYAFSHEAYTPILLPLADGGDGTLETLVAATGGKIYRKRVRGPLGQPVEAAWGRLGGPRADTAIIEMAEAAGLRLLRPEERNPLQASTYGVGELIGAAVEAGCTTILVGIGGSATNDGGAGMAQALGAKLLDASGHEIDRGGAALLQLHHIDLSGWKLPSKVRVIVACDVENPLCGVFGASLVYGPQKGATAEMAALLDKALKHYAQVLKRQLGKAVEAISGGGSAGGLGAGLMAFCNAELRSGIELVLEVLNFDDLCRRSQLVLTGEGRLDAQTLHGKAIGGVVRHARALNKPVIALVGSLEAEAECALVGEGLLAAVPLVEGPCSLEEAMQNAAPLIRRATVRVLRLLAAGGAFS